MLKTLLSRCMIVSATVFVVALGVTPSINPTHGFSQNPDGWEIAPKPDEHQYLDDSVPVFVFRVVSGPENREEGKNAFVIKETIVENRSNKNVDSIVLRWVITPMNDESSVLLSGKMAPHKLADLYKTLMMGRRQTLKLSVPPIASLLKSLPTSETYSNRFKVLIGVAKVVFDDGSTWEDGAFYR